MRTSIIKSNIEVHGHKFAVDREVARFMRDYAAKHAEAVFSIQPTAKAMRSYADDLRDRAVAQGRRPEDIKIIFALQVVVDESLARPTLIGRPDIIAQRCRKFGLRLEAEKDYDVVNTEHDHRYRDYWQTYHAMTVRKGVTAQFANGNSVIAPKLNAKMRPVASFSIMSWSPL